VTENGVAHSKVPEDIPQIGITGVIELDKTTIVAGGDTKPFMCKTQ
jgi:hypothetical protein